MSSSTTTQGAPHGSAHAATIDRRIEDRKGGEISRSAPDGINDSENWEWISIDEAPKVNANPTRNRYLDFQLNIRFAQLSVVARPATMDSVGADGSIHQQDQSPLFRLPVEIRLYIYELLLRVPATGFEVKLTKRPVHEHPPSVLTVLLTCRRVLEEAEGIFYSINRLSADHPDFLASLGPRRRNAITQVAWPVTSASSTLHRLQQLHRAPNLKSLYILRQLSVKFTDATSWAVMSRQLVAEIEKMEALEEVKILTPKATNLSEHDMARKQKLNEIDRRLCGAARGSVLHTAA